MIDFTGVTGITIPEGNVIKIENANGVLWELPITTDTTPPEITAVANGGIYTSNKQVYVRDENLSSVTINGTSQTFTGTEFYKKFASDGSYTIVATDSYGNSKTVSFILDKTAPSINVKTTSVQDDTGAYTSLSLQLVDTVSGIDYFTLDGKKYARSGKYVDLNDGAVFVWTTGEHTLVAYDKAGLSTTKTFVVNKG